MLVLFQGIHFQISFTEQANRMRCSFYCRPQQDRGTIRCCLLCLFCSWKKKYTHTINKKNNKNLVCNSVLGKRHGFKLWHFLYRKSTQKMKNIQKSDSDGRFFYSTCLNSVLHIKKASKQKKKTRLEDISTINWAYRAGGLELGNTRAGLNLQRHSSTTETWVLRHYVFLLSPQITKYVFPYTM